MYLIKKLVSLCNKYEIIKHLKLYRYNISKGEVETLKEQYKVLPDKNNILSIKQLDSVSGGNVEIFLRKCNLSESLKKKIHSLVRDSHPNLACSETQDQLKLILVDDKPTSKVVLGGNEQELERYFSSIDKLKKCIEGVISKEESTNTDLGKSYSDLPPFHPSDSLSDFNSDADASESKSD